MSREQQKRGKQEKGSDGAEKVIVAVKASREIPKTALVWSLTHVVQPGDCITLLVVVPSQTSGRRLWGFPRFAGDCASGIKKYPPGTISEQKSDITDSCSQMILQLHDVYDPNKINVRIKIVSGSPCGAVAAEAKKAQANWVVLDKQLKHEEKRCMEELQCNIVVMKRSQPKVLRLNLIGPQKKDVEEASPSSPSEQDDVPEKQTKKKIDSLNSIKGPTVTPTSSPELGTPFTTTEAGTSSASSSDPGTSPFFISEMNGESKKEETIQENHELGDTNSDTESESLSTSSASLRFQPWITELLLHQQSSQRNEDRLDRGAGIEVSTYRSDSDFSGNLREAIALSGNAPPGPPPLCSICQHKAPVFGKPPRWFSYAELELATGYDVGNRSGRIWSEPLQRQHHYSGPLLEESLESFSGKLSLDKYKPSYWDRDRDKARRDSCDDDI
ncbi:Inactive protein kinase [Sesbania bispinosa]|nr:Inactive protein kinase [Sesbania bispinosa]